MNPHSPRRAFHTALSARKLSAIALLFALSTLLAPAKQNPLSPGGRIENFGKVNENYYRGEQPDESGFSELHELGIKTVIDLRKDSVREAPELARKQGLQYFNIPLTTKHPATEEQAEYFLKLVNDPANWPVYVHCKGGRHRTGEMTALYRIAHDRWTAAQAYDEMKKYDFEDSFFYPKVLKKHVFAFYERYTSNNPAIGQ